MMKCSWWRNPKQGNAKRLAKEEGIFAGTLPTDVAAALQLAKKLGQGKNVVTVACDSGMKYINTGLFDG